MSMLPPGAPVDLTNCDREPIHIPGSIQSHGCLLACDPSVTTIWQHSANAPGMLGVERQLNGMALVDILGPEALHTLRNAVIASRGASHPSLIFALPLANGRAFDIAVHEHRSIVIIEFEVPGAGSSETINLSRALISRISNIEDIDNLVAHATRLISGALGYDRVMAYRFDVSGAGKVISEVKRPDLESFAGQYFPAGDIPQQARALYLKNTIRIISDSSGTRIPIIAGPGFDREPLDLSFAHLRSVSPIHCEYLRNMGVAASMSISIVVDGELWGLIACHHYSPKALPMIARVAAEMFGEFFSLHLQVLRQKLKLDTATRARQSLDRFLHLTSQHAHVGDVLREHLDDFARLLPCNGAGLWVSGRWSGVGATPPDDAIPGLARFLNTVADGRVWSTHMLSQRWAGAEAYYREAAGLIAIPLSRLPRDYLFFFRKEVIQTLDWAGNPDKTYASGPLGERLTPRTSFAIWKQTVHMQSDFWTDTDLEIAEAVRAALVETVLRHNELMAEERDKADVRQRMLNEELNHRVKNILAIIRSLLGQPTRQNRDLEEYVASLRGRIQALAFAHDQVVRGDGGGLLKDLLDAELTPYRSSEATVTLAGPPVWIDSRAFSVMALVLHELSTNAAKYGALSRQGGRLAVSWTIGGDGNLHLNWQESGGPTVAPPTREGFGSALIDRSIPYDLGGTSRVDYAPGGVRGEFLIPARHIAGIDPGDPDDSARIADASDAPDIPSGLHVLLVEDQMLIAMDAENMLADGGMSQVTTSNSADEALRRLKDFTPDVAVLDVNLGVTTSIPVAEELARRGVPFVFATGYGDSPVIPAAFASIPVVRKPYDVDMLTTAIHRVVAGAAD